MIFGMKSIVKYFVFLIVYGLFFSFLGGLSFYVYLGTRFTPAPWHVVNLEGEFTSSLSSEIPDFDAYQKLEQRLFVELREKVYQTPSKPGSQFNRYNLNSLSDPFRFDKNWNQSFEMTVDNPRGGFLMVHGLTDSPYSVRSLAEKMHRLGFWVVGLRLPGHGTIPAALTQVNWPDWAAAFDLGAQRVRDKIGPDLPFFVLGYSTGAALAVEYSLRIAGGEQLPKPDGLILLSPAMGLPPVASLAKFQLGLSRLPGLGKLAWESVMMEYDPFKYNSFPVNAGEQVYQLTVHIQNQLKKLHDSKTLQSFPRVLVFQSIVDATVHAEAVVDNFLNRLPARGNHLVLYDVNQRALNEGLLAKSGNAFKSRLLGIKDLPFDLTIITNVNRASNDIQALQKKAMQGEVQETAIPYSWPLKIFSLSHVALPFPPDDPVYGNLSLSNSEHIRLGRIALWGEKGVFGIPQGQLMRLRYNPFYNHMLDRIMGFIVEGNRSGQQAEDQS